MEFPNVAGKLLISLCILCFAYVESTLLSSVSKLIEINDLGMQGSLIARQ